MGVFEDVVETNKTIFARGKEPAAHVVLIRDGKAEAMMALPFIDEYTKQIALGFVLPSIIVESMPEGCIFVLPSKLKMLNTATGEITREDDVIVIHEVDAIKMRTVIIKRNKNGEVEVIEPSEESTQANLMEPVRKAMKKAWAEMI